MIQRNIVLMIPVLFASYSTCSAQVIEKEMLIDNFESVEKWKGFELSSINVKEGKYSAKWSRMDKTPTVTTSDIPHDWSKFNHIKLWIFSEKALRARFMIILHSENEATSGMDYYAIGIPLSYTGWKHFVFPMDEMPGARSPLGWDQIQRITFTATGWGNTPHPEAVVYIDDFKLTFEPKRPGPRMTDQEFFDALDLDRPGLEKVKSAYTKGDIPAAKREYLNYMRSREKPVWFFDWRDRPKNVKPVTGGSEGWDYYSQTLTVDWKGWKRFELKKSSFGKARKPIGWHRINYIAFNASGWGHTPDPNTTLLFDDIRLVGREGTEDVILGDFENEKEMQKWAGINTLSDEAKRGKHSGVWKDMHLNRTMRISDIPHDWTDYESLSFWAYSPKATGAQIQIVLESDTPNTDAADKILKHLYRGYFLGEDIDWQSNPVDPKDPSFTREWTYDLNRFYFWNTLGQAYWQTGDEKYAKEWIAQMVDWVEDAPVPLYSTGNQTLRWRTIECGIRTAGSWMNAYHYFLSSPSFDPESHVTFIKSFVEHARHLMKITLDYPERTGNWITMECNGLAHIGVMFPEFKEAKTWVKTAYDRLYRELERQVYPDGAQIELTTGYHQVSLNNFLGATRIAKLNDVALPPDYMKKLEKMYHYNLYAMMPNGHLPPLNDAGMSDVRRGLAEAAEMYNRSDFEFASSAGTRGTKPEHDSYAFPYAGQFIMRSGWDSDDRYLMFDAGPFGAGHQHEDKLSIFTYAYGRVHIIEPGNYSYDASKWRRFVLSTPAHNTILVDGQGQHRRGLRETYIVKEPLPNRWTTTDGLDLAIGTYESGYGPKRDKSVTHTRKVIFIKPDYWVVIDLLTGTGRHKFESLFHLNADDAQLNEDDKSVRTTDTGQSNIVIVPLAANELSLQMVKGQEDPVQGWIPARKRPIPTAIFVKEAECPTTYEMVLYPYLKGKSPSVRVSGLQVIRDGRRLARSEASAFRVDIEGVGSDIIFVSHTPPSLTKFGDYETDAEIACVRMDLSGKIKAKLMIGGTTLK